jgi:hypothetical protein
VRGYYIVARSTFLFHFEAPPMTQRQSQEEIMREIRDQLREIRDRLYLNSALASASFELVHHQGDPDSIRRLEVMISTARARVEQNIAEIENVAAKLVAMQAIDANQSA